MQRFAACGHKSASSQSLRFILSLRLYSSFITSRPGIDNNKQPVANVTDGNVQLYVLSHIPDNFQCVAEMVLDCLPNLSLVDFVTDISKENSIKFVGRKQRGTSKILLI